MTGDHTAALNINGHKDWEASVDEVLAVCDGDARGALRTLLIANEYLHSEVDRLETMISRGYVRRSARTASRAATQV